MRRKLYISLKSKTVLQRGPNIKEFLEDIMQIESN